MDTPAAIREAIRLAGGLNRLAEAIGVERYQTIQGWVATASVPAEYCPKIEQVTGGAVRCEDLRPNVDWAYLRSTAPSPKPSPRASGSGARKEGQDRSAASEPAGAEATGSRNACPVQTTEAA